MEVSRPIEVPFALGQVDNRQTLSLKKKFQQAIIILFFSPFLPRIKLSTDCLQSFLPISLSLFHNPTTRSWPRTTGYTICDQLGYQSRLVLFLLKGLTPTGSEKRELETLEQVPCRERWNLQSCKALVTLEMFPFPVESM